MRARFAIKEPDGVEVELTLTLRLGQWKELRAQLSSEYPSWKLSACITALVNEAEKSFTAPHERDV